MEEEDFNAYFLILESVMNYFIKSWSQIVCDSEMTGCVCVQCCANSLLVKLNVVHVCVCVYLFEPFHLEIIFLY